ncbi:MAG: L-threonylcarbamoyladenylate synthase [Acidimicrobiales bacterium]
MAAAVAALQAGEAVVVPTDTVYGVAALPSVDGATQRLFALKERAGDHPLAVLVSESERALALVEAPTDAVHELMARAWPGPLTVVLRRAPSARSLELGGDDVTIGLRCPDHGLLLDLLARVGPLATTSANRHGQPTPVTAAAAAAALSGPVAMVLDGGRCAGQPSTVVDCTVTPWRVLRAGAFAIDGAGGPSRP